MTLNLRFNPVACKTLRFCHINATLMRTSLHGFTPGRVAQLVTCLATDPGVVSSIPAWSHTYVEIDHDVNSTVTLLSSAESFKKGCCQLQAKVCARSTGELLVQACQGKSVFKMN